MAVWSSYSSPFVPLLTLDSFVVFNFCVAFHCVCLLHVLKHCVSCLLFIRVLLRRRLPRNGFLGHNFVRLCTLILFDTEQ